MIKKKSIEIHLHTNYSCNLLCKHCYNNSSNHNKCKLSSDLALDIIKEVCEKYNAEIHLEGGEIFLLSDFLAAMNELPDEVLRCITITTNGTIRHENKTILNMLSRIGALRVSVEGHTDEHQRAIRSIGIKSVLENAHFYKENNIPVWLRVTLHRYNYKAFVEKTLPSLNDEGFNKIQVYEFQNVGRGDENKLDFALGDSIEWLLKELEEKNLDLNSHIRMMFPKKRIPEILEHKALLEEKGYCVQLLEPEAGVSIHADGKVFLCAWENNPKECIIDISQTNIEHFMKTIENMELLHQCSHCSAIRITKG